MFAQVPVLHRKKPSAEVRHNDWHSGNPLWGKTTSWPRLRFCWRPPVVCGKSGQVEKRSSSQYSSPQIIFRIVLLFDANKLDISDEFRRSIEAIHGYEDKVRIVLNKADQVATPSGKITAKWNDQTSGRPPRTDASLWCSHVVDIQGLILVSRHILQDHSKVINVPECPKIYVGSFWDQQLKHDLYRRLFEKELQSLFDDLQDLPR